MFVDTEARPQGEPQKVGTLKLSDAIRIGAGLRGQCISQPFMHGRSCALGAAYEALNGKTWPEDNFPGFPWMDLLEKFGDPDFLFHEITRMNDCEGKTREQIADWLESQGY